MDLTIPNKPTTEDEFYKIADRVRQEVHALQIVQGVIAIWAEDWVSDSTKWASEYFGVTKRTVRKWKQAARHYLKRPQMKGRSYTQIAEDAGVYDKERTHDKAAPGGRPTPEPNDRGDRSVPPTPEPEQPTQEDLKRNKALKQKRKKRKKVLDEVFKPDQNEFVMTLLANDVWFKIGKICEVKETVNPEILTRLRDRLLKYADRLEVKNDAIRLRHTRNSSN